MRVMTLGLVLAAASLAACGGAPDPWIAANTHAADAAAGGETLLRNNFALVVEGEAPELGEEDMRTCSVTAPAVEIVQQGALGTARVAGATEIIDEPDSPCDGLEAQGTGVYYDAASGVAGIDTIVYREFGESADPDILHTVEIRVR